MQAKKQLMRYSRLKKENENRAETLARIRAVENYLEYEEQMRPLMEKNRAEMLRIEQAVDALPDPLEREVLRLRYLDGDAWRLPKWRDVAMKIYGDDDAKDLVAVHRLHEQALSHLIC